MLYIDDCNNITLTKGDTLTLEVALYKRPTPGTDPEPYTPVEGDEIRFALSKSYVGMSDYKLLVNKPIDIDTLTFTVSSQETGALNYGTFNYDVELTHADGTVDTFISAKMTITGEAE